MHHYRDVEKEEFFSNIKLISDIKGLIERNVEQRQEFTADSTYSRSILGLIFSKTTTQIRSEVWIKILQSH
jgi:hypothetical protein